MQNGCATSIEATITGIPVVTYLPFDQRKFSRKLANEIGYQVKNHEELSQTVNHLFAKRNDLNKKKDKCNYLKIY